MRTEFRRESGRRDQRPALAPSVRCGSVVVGKSITLNGHPFTVIGVAAPEFTGLLFRAINSDLWAPVMMMGQLRTDQLANRDERWMFVKARLASGATAERAAQTLTGLGARLAASYPESNRGRTFATRRTTDVMMNPDGDRVVFPAALVLLVAVGFVVLIAATNVANLMFARAASRQREIAIRLALGASRRQLVGQLLIESSLLAAIGGALGLGLAFVFARCLSRFTRRFLFRFRFRWALTVASCRSPCSRRRWPR